MTGVIAGRVVTVHRPWAWIRWPSNIALVQQDPDVADHRRARLIAVADVDWARVFQAVLYATWEVCSSQRFQAEPVRVSVPLPLTDTEWLLAQTWVGEASPVSLDAFGPAVFDGRHRLWLTRDEHADRGFVPIAVDDLFFLAPSSEGAGGPSTGDLLFLLRQLVEWVEHDPALAALNPGWGRRLARAYLQLSGSNPLPSWWFERLTDWDNRLETLIELHQAGRAGSDLLSAELTRSWRAKQDHTKIDARTLIEMFHQIGFRVDDQPGPRPGRPLTLFRGATANRASGLSWTIDPQVAEHFAMYRQGPTGGRVWRTTVKPGQVVAYISDENEYIVDLHDHQAAIEPVDAAGCRVDRRTWAATRRIVGHRKGDWWLRLTAHWMRPPG